MFPLCCQICLVLLLAGTKGQSTEVPEVEGGESSSSKLAEFVDNLIDQMNDVKESREREAKKTEVEEVEMLVEEDELPSWKVSHEEGDGFCLLISAEVKLELLGLSGVNKSLTVPVSEKAEVEGRCLEGKSEVRFVWHSRNSEEENLINLVVEHDHETPNLVYLSGAFLRLHHHQRRLEFYTSMGSLEHRTLLWPIRYQLRCPELRYRLMPIEEQRGREENASAVLYLTDIRIEVYQSALSNPHWLSSMIFQAFRGITLQNHRPESFGVNWYRREWKCEFHRIYDWAPYLVGCGLFTTLLIFVAAFLCRDSLERKKTKTWTKYESL